MKTHIHNLFIAFGLAVAFFSGEAKATTIFPIATNNADFSLSMASDGTNYLVGIQGDYAGPGYYITAQMFSPTGALLGPRINPVPGHTTGGFPLYPSLAYSGTNYLMVWPDNYLGGSYSSISGQLISPSGGLIGGMIAITTNSQQGMCSVAFGGGKYLVLWNDFSTTPNGAVYGQLVSTAGALLGGSFVIGADVYGQGADDASAAFDGTNFLVGWTLNFSGGSHNVTYGVFISPSGTLGTPFAIGQTASASMRGPPFLIFNGTNYLVVWNFASETGGADIWNIYGRFMTPSSTFPGNEFVIVTNASICGLAFDGANYLLCSSVNLGATNSDVQFQFLNSSGQPTGPQFTPFTAQGNEVPLVASLLYDGKRFVSAATLSANGPFVTDNAGIYGTFIPVRYGIADTSTWVVNKHQYFNQTNSGLPVFQNPSTPYDFEAAAEPSTPGLVLGLSVKLPNATSQSGLPENDAPGYGVNAQFSTLAALDAAYPAGQYVLAITNANDGIKVVTNNLPASVYPSTPHISNYDAAQNINPLVDFTLTWDAFTNGTASDLIRLQVSDTNGNTVFSSPTFTTGELTGLSNSVVIPANTLTAGKTYSASLDFLKVINIDTNSYPGADGLTLFWKETDFNLQVTATPAGNIVVNGGFETGDFTGWTLSGSDTSDILVDDGSQTGIKPHSGNYLAALEPVGSLSYLSQSLSTVPGQSYLVSLWLNSPDGLTPNEFPLSWNGNTLFDQTDLPALGWTNIQFTVIATGTSTLLQFGSRDDPSFLGLDDVSVQPGEVGPTIQFTASPTTGAPPLAVQFNSPSVDSSGSNIVSWVWAFGDGSTSTLQNPSHTYTTTGTFTPTLIATNINNVAVVGSGPQIAALPPTSSTNFTYITNNGTITITGYIGSDSGVIIPNLINGLPVTSIGDFAFELTSLTSVLIPNSVLNIGVDAFVECDNLTNATIGTNVTSIGDGAFEDCPALTDITIPNSVTNIGAAPFAGDGSLTAITVDALNSFYSSVGVVLFDKSQTMLIQYPEGNVATSYIIPNTVTSIGIDAIGPTSLTNITIPNSVTTIGDYAFGGSTSLVSITIPSSVTSIGASPFSVCSSLIAINVNTNNPVYISIAGVLFNHDQTTLIEYPDGKVASTYIIPSSVTSIGEGAFDDCSLTSITIPNSVTSIGVSAFYQSFNLTSVTISGSVTSIGSLAFAYCPLTSVYFEGNAPSADSYTFYGDNTATVYYLPGTTGWGATFAGLPTALWFLPNPLILNSAPSFGVQSNGFGFTISWATNIPVIVEASTHLANHNWSPISTNTLTGSSSYFIDPQWTNSTRRFYRLRSP